MNKFISVKTISTALLLCGISTALLLVALAFICNSATLDPRAIRTITFAISVISVFLWSFVSVRGIERGGLINGGAVGILYGIVFLFLSSMCSGGFVFSAHTATIIFAVILSGAAGGVAGINIGR